MGFVSIGLSQLSTEYILIPVSASKSGLPYNPTGDTVQFAFMPTPTQVPQPSDFSAGSWDVITTDIIYPYAAKILVGPAGTVTLGIGTYVIYIKVQDSPEVPVRIVGQVLIN